MYKNNNQNFNGQGQNRKPSSMRILFTAVMSVKDQLKVVKQRLNDVVNTRLCLIKWCGDGGTRIKELEAIVKNQEERLKKLEDIIREKKDE